MDINVEELIKLLPEGYQQACYETKAIERKRTVQTPEELLVMCLYYIYGASLLETSQLAKMNGTGKMSDVAFMKRFAKSSRWFQWITKNIKPGDMCHYQKPGILQEYNVTIHTWSRKCASENKRSNRSMDKRENDACTVN